MITLRSGLTVGQDAPVRVNCNIGCNSEDEYSKELAKIKAIKETGAVPDMMMDLSLVRMQKPLYLVAQEKLQVETGTVLSYIPFCKDKGLEWEICKDYLYELCDNGISFVTIHFTANNELLQLATETRKVPVTSRGGGMCLYDQKINNHDNQFYAHIDEIAEIVCRYDVAVSLGSTFRPANIFEACDEVHIKETQKQLEVCKYLQSKDVKVMVENVGHIGLDKIEQHANVLRKFCAPIMPLGPLPTDVALDMDHINNAIGASFAAYLDCAHIINSVTRYEHSHSDFSVESIIEGIKTARLAAHVVNVSKGIDLDCDRKIATLRENNKSCMIDGATCSRCSNVCPLKQTYISQ